MDDQALFHEPVEDWDNEAAVLFSEIEDLSKDSSLSTQDRSVPSNETSALNNDQTENIILKKLKGYVNICDSRIKYYRSFEGKQIYPLENQNQIQKWLLEKNTWKLIISIFSLKLEKNISFIPICSENSLSDIDLNQIDELPTDFDKVLKLFS
ncbi:hypothetical protein AYI69_g4862, partial [Smittium culicis]